MIIVVVFGLPLLFFFLPHTNHYKTIGGKIKPPSIMFNPKIKAVGL